MITKSCTPKLCLMLWKNSTGAFLHFFRSSVSTIIKYPSSVHRNEKAKANSTFYSLENIVEDKKDEVKITHVRFSNLHRNIVKSNNTMGTNRTLPNSSCKSSDHINLTKNITQTGCAGKPDTC